MQKNEVFDLRILIIDDNEEITEAIHFFCESMKAIGCYTINNGQEGLERIKKEKFDLVMLDLAMSEFSGYEVIRQLKQDGALESNDTASSDVEILNEIENSGVKEVFKKPFSLNGITALIEKYRPRTDRMGMKEGNGKKEVGRRSNKRIQMHVLHNALDNF